MATYCPNCDAFQSTLPIREETHPIIGTAVKEDFNPLFPYGKRPGDLPFQIVRRAISIHSSHTGRDPEPERPAEEPEISIHSSHTGRDGTRQPNDGRSGHFNPLFPYGKRPDHRGGRSPGGAISIHSSHTGRDGGL